MEAFSDSVTQEVEDSVKLPYDELGQELCDNVNLQETSPLIVDSVASASKSHKLVLGNKLLHVNKT